MQHSIFPKVIMKYVFVTYGFHMKDGLISHPVIMKFICAIHIIIYIWGELTITYTRSGTYLAINTEKALRTTAPAWEALEQNYYVASWGYDIYDVDKRGSKVLEVTPFRKKIMHPFYLAAGDRFIPMAVGDRWMRVSVSLQALFKLQNQDIEAMKGHEIKLYYNGALLLTYVLDTIPKIEKLFETLQNLVNIYEQPNYVKVSIAADK